MPNDYTDAFIADPYRALKIFQISLTLDVMPSDFVTFRLEYGHRESNLPFFTSSNGTISPSGCTNGPTTIVNWRPDLQKKEDRITLAINFRV